MAVSYQIPPWIGGAGSALGAVQAGASLGARIAEANQRAALSYAELQAQQQRFAAQMQMEQMRLEAEQRLQDTRLQVAQEREMYDRMRDDQQMEMSKAKLQAEVGLKKQALDLQTQTAAQSFAEQQGYLKDQNALVKAITAKNPDIPQEEAWRQASRIAAFRHPGMGKIAPGFEAMIGKQPPSARTGRGFTLGNDRYEYDEQGKPHVVATKPPAPERSVVSGDLIADPKAQGGYRVVPTKISGIPSSKILTNAPAVPGVNAPAQKVQSTAPFAEGQLIRNKQDGKMYRLIQGQPVPADQQEPAQETPSPNPDETE